MGEPRTRATDASVELFISAQGEQRRRECAQLIEMHEQLVGEPATMWGASIIGFGRYAATRSDGKTHEWPVAGFSPRKQALTLYITPGFDGFKTLLGQLGKHTVSKACLYIRELADVDLQVLEKIVAGSLAAIEPQRIRR